MVDIFDEISDDLRAERAAALLRRYGILFIAAAILALLAVAGQQFWQSYQAKQNSAAAAKFLGITGQIDTLGAGITNAQQIANAQALAGFAATAPAGYRSLANLRAAALYAAAGQIDAAEGLWNNISADTSADPLLRQLADLLWAQQELCVRSNASTVKIEFGKLAYPV